MLICDDGSTEDISTVLAEAASLGLRAVHLRQANQGPGSARNLGLKHASGGIAAFTDSDCVPDPDWLLTVAKAFEDRSVGLLGGTTGYRDSELLSSRCANFLMSTSLGAAGARDPRSLVHMRFYPRTCNLAVRRELAIAINGFSRFSHGEDLEFSHHIRELGVCVRFVPGAIVTHDKARSLGQFFREFFFKGAARVRLWHHCGAHELIHSLPAVFCLYILAATVAITLVPSNGAILAIPTRLAYLVLLAIVGLHGAIAVGELRAAWLTPIFALIMHVGYGLGYWVAILNPGSFQRAAGRACARLRALARVFHPHTTN